MISIPRLLAELEGRGILLSVADGQLRYRGPDGALTPADRETLRARKAEILDYLQAREAGLALRALKGRPGPATPSVGQEMWWPFAGPQEGQPLALNIGMVGLFAATGPDMLEGAIRALIARHQALCARIAMTGDAMRMTLNPPEDFVVERVDFAGDAAAAQEDAYRWCAVLVPIQGDWLIRARIYALADGSAVAALSASHIIADAGTRNIVMAEIELLLDHARAGTEPPPPRSVPFNDYSLAERDFLASPRGEALIAYWRRWNAGQPVMHAPRTGMPLQWAPGRRQLHNLAIPGRILERVQRFAHHLGATPFLVYLTLYVMTLSRWSGLARFPIRILGDKRTALEVAETVGLMFCADAADVAVPEGADFRVVLRGILADVQAAQETRLPTMHFWAPHCVRPGIEVPDFPNRIPAVFNYYSAGTARERAGQAAEPDMSSTMPWPPNVARPPVQHWPRRSSPIFLHIMDVGSHAAVSFHFQADMIDDAGQADFVDTFFQIFAQMVPE